MEPCFEPHGCAARSTLQGLPAQGQPKCGAGRGFEPPMAWSKSSNSGPWQVESLPRRLCAIPAEMEPLLQHPFRADSVRAKPVQLCCGELLELRHGAPGHRNQALLRLLPVGFRFGKCGRGYLRFALWAVWAAPPRRDAAFAFARLPRFVRAAQSLGNGRHTRHGAARFRPQSRADRKVRRPEE